jgi:soluble lytic murein transglycosylase-like protein
MSATISLRSTMARRTDAALHLVQHGLMIAGLLLVFALVSLLANGVSPTGALKSVVPDFVISADAAEDSPEGTAAANVLSSRMQAALNYVTRRYRVSPEALLPVFEAAQFIGQERHIDPLLIVAIIGVESGFNPFAESAMGAQGLMQVIPRFHQDKLPDGAGVKPFLDPETNIRVGAVVLEEAIRRRGGLVAGLQYYAGSSDAEGAYATKVLAEKERLEQAARRSTGSNVRSALG